jgi:5-hydroxyisourate hydrolase-like protein (transthyretin family)
MILEVLGLLLAAQASAAAPEKCTIEGRVLRAGSGDPIRKVQVTLFREQVRPSTPNFSVTDDNGRFSFTGLDPGRYRLSAERNGYVRQQFGQRGQTRAGAPLVLERGQAVGDLVLRLIPAAILTGRVVDDEGEPVPSVRVELFRYGYVQGRRQRMPAGGASTNDLGEYRIFGLAPGRYFLSATWAFMGFMGSGGAVVAAVPGPQPTELTYAPTFFPGTADAAQAAPLEITAGAEMRGIDLRLLRIPTVRIRGKVLNAVTGRPGTRIMVGLMTRNDPNMSRNFSAVEADGRFELRGVTPGSYDVTANWSEGSQRYFASQPVEVGNSPIEGIQLVIAPGVEISGRLQVEGQADLTSAEFHVSLPAADNRGMFGAGEALVENDGSFRLRNVNPGKYRVSFYAGGGADDLYLKSARMGDADVLDTDLDIRPGQGAAQLELVMSSKSARVEGSVSDDQSKPLSGVQVVLVPDSSRRSIIRLFKTAATDQQGRFTLRGIAPGEYKLLVFDDLEFGAQYDPEFLKQHEEKGKSLSLRESSQESVTMKLTPVGGSTR